MARYLIFALSGAMPIWIVASGAFFLGADAPTASYFLSGLLLLCATVQLLMARRAPSLPELGVVAVFALLTLIASLRGWLDAGAHEYIALAAWFGLVFFATRVCAKTENVDHFWELILVAGGLVAFVSASSTR